MPISRAHPPPPKKKHRAPIKLAQPFPAPELWAIFFTDIRLFLITSSLPMSEDSLDLLVIAVSSRKNSRDSLFKEVRVFSPRRHSQGLCQHAARSVWEEQSMGLCHDVLIEHEPSR